MEILSNEVLKLHLPDFVLPERSLDEFLTSKPVDIISGANWNSTTQILMFTASDLISIDLPVVIVLKSGSGLRIPLQGLRSNEHSRDMIGENYAASSPCPDDNTFSNCRSCDRSDLTPLQLPEISIESRWGPVLPVRVYKTPAIGCFLDSRIELNPAKAGAAVRIEISFTSMMTLKRFETVSVTLANFQGAATRGTVNASIFDEFSWNPLQSTLVLTVGRQCVQRGEHVTAILSASVGIEIGVGGIQQAPFFHTAAQDGPILPTPFSWYQKIGSFSYANVRYEPPRVNAIVNIVAQFIPTMPFVFSDRIELTLTSVEVLNDDPSDSCGIPVLVKGFGDFESLELESWSADWTGALGTNCPASGHPNTLVITILSANVSAGTAIEIVVSNSSSLRIPVTGTTENDVGVFLSTTANSGLVLFQYPYVVPISEQVREISIARASSLTFSNPRWNSSSALTFAFRFDVVVSKGDRILIHLPKFNGGPKTYVPAANHSKCPDSSCDWLVCSPPKQSDAPENSNVSNVCECNCKISEINSLPSISSQSFQTAAEGQYPWILSNLKNSSSLTDSMSAEWVASDNLLVFVSNVYMPTNYTTVLGIPNTFNFIIPVSLS